VYRLIRSAAAPTRTAANLSRAQRQSPDDLPGSVPGDTKGMFRFSGESIMRATLSLVLFAGLIGGGVAHAGDPVYRWTDADGVTHYSDTPPENQTFEEHDVRAPAAARVDPAPEDGKAPPVNANCLQVQRNIEALERSEVVSMDIDGDGKADQLTPEQRDTQLTIARSQLDIYCKKADEADPQD